MTWKRKQDICKWVKKTNSKKGTVALEHRVVGWICTGVGVKVPSASMRFGASDPVSAPPLMQPVCVSLFHVLHAVGKLVSCPVPTGLILKNRDVQPVVTVRVTAWMSRGFVAGGEPESSV